MYIIHTAPAPGFIRKYLILSFTGKPTYSWTRDWDRAQIFDTKYEAEEILNGVDYEFPGVPMRIGKSFEASRTLINELVLI